MGTDSARFLYQNQDRIINSEPLQKSPLILDFIEAGDIFKNKGHGEYFVRFLVDRKSISRKKILAESNKYIGSKFRFEVGHMPAIYKAEVHHHISKNTRKSTLGHLDFPEAVNYNYDSKADTKRNLADLRNYILPVFNIEEERRELILLKSHENMIFFLSLAIAIALILISPILSVFATPTIAYGFLKGRDTESKIIGLKKKEMKITQNLI